MIVHMTTAHPAIKVERFTVNYFEECTYVLYDTTTREAVIVDCGVYSARERERFLLFLQQNMLRPVRLLMTHGHHDHLYGNDLVLEHYGLLPEVHEDDRPLLGEHLNNRLNEVYKGKYPYRIPMPEHYLVDGEVIPFGQFELKVIHTPGHSPGSVFFYCKDGGFAFSGDTLYKDDIGSTALAFGDRELMFDSLDHVMQLLPDDTVIYPGHGGKSTIGDERENLFSTSF